MDTASKHTDSPPKRKHRILRLLWIPVLLLLVVALLVAAAPRILSTAWGRETTLSQARSRLPGWQLDVQAWHWRWWRPCHITGLELRHPDGRLTVPQIEFSRGLAAWLPVGRLDLGTIKITAPELTLPAHTEAGGGRAATNGPAVTPPPTTPAADAPAFKLPIQDLAAHLVISSASVIQDSAAGSAVTLVAAGEADIDLQSLSLPVEARILLELPSPGGASGHVALIATAAAPLAWLTTPDRPGPSHARLTLEELDLARLAQLLPPAPERPTLEGRMDAQCDLELTSLQAVALSATLGVRSLRVTPPGPTPPDLPTASASLRLSAGITNGVISVATCRAQTPWLHAELQGRLEQLPSAASPRPQGQGTAHIQADLARLMTDFAPLLGLDPKLKVNGGTLTGDLTFAGSPQMLDVDLQAGTQALDMRYDGAAIALNPAPHLAVQVQWPVEGTPRFDQLTLTLPGGTLQGQGDARSAAFDGRFDLGELTRLLDQIVATLPFEAQGTLTCQAKMSTGRDDSAHIELSANAQNLHLAKDGRSYDDPQLEFGAELTRTPTGIELPFLRLKSALLDAAGSLTRRTTQQREMQLIRGNSAIHYDTLNRWRKQAGWHWPVIAGSALRPISLTWPTDVQGGALIEQLQLSATTHVARIEAYDLKLGAADLGLSMSGGIATLGYAAPFDGGHLTLNPSADLTRSPPLLTLPPGRPVDNLPLTQSMVEEILVHINPLLRGCAVIGGRISVDVASCSVPLDADVLQRELAFEATLSLTNAVFAPAGVLNELLALAGLGGRELRLESYALPVSCRNGRITPAPMRASVAGHPLVFSGSVGLDQTVNMLMQTPLSEELVGKSVAKYTEGLTLDIAIGGTITRPRIDRDGTRAQLQKLTREAARGAAVQELGGALDRWLKKRTE